MKEYHEAVQRKQEDKTVGVCSSTSQTTLRVQHPISETCQNFATKALSYTGRVSLPFLIL